MHGKIQFYQGSVSLKHTFAKGASPVSDLGQARHEAKICAQGVGNSMFVIDPSYL